MDTAFEYTTRKPPQQKRQPLTLGCTIWKSDHDHKLHSNGFVASVQAYSSTLITGAILFPSPDAFGDRHDNADEDADRNQIFQPTTCENSYPTLNAATEEYRESDCDQATASGIIVATSFRASAVYSEEAAELTTFGGGNATRRQPPALNKNTICEAGPSTATAGDCHLSCGTPCAIGCAGRRETGTGANRGSGGGPERRCGSPALWASLG
jgi:hypothetical protein